MRIAIILLFVWVSSAAAADLRVAPPAADAITAALARERPRVFALEREALARPDDVGDWTVEAGERVWRHRVEAPGAQSLSLYFDRFGLPAGASLRVISGDGRVVQGPYGARHGRKGRLWTGLVPGEVARIELRLPADASVYQLRLARVGWGFADPRPRAKRGACNIDVACPQGDDWRDQIDATVMVQYAEGGFIASCSATLINNARRDLTPYLLTADHCEIDRSNDDSVIVYWNYQTETCRGPESEQPDPSQSQAGTEFLASGFLANDPHPDFTLLVIGSLESPDVPPASFSPFWSGWDSRFEVPLSGAGIHHPTGDEKSISLFEDPASASEVDIGANRPDVILSWQLIWDQGTTEIGSSGSGLWNQDRRLVGQLSGGGASCQTPQEPDYYGRFNESWEWEPVLSRQLRRWLDPDCSGANVLDGIDRTGRDTGYVLAGAPQSVDATGAVCGSTGGNGGDPGGDGGGAMGGSGIASLTLALALMRRRRRGASR